MSRVQKVLLIIVLALVVAFLLSILVTDVLEYYESTQVKELTSTSTYTISNETRFASPFKAFVQKGAFDSVAELYVYISSPYANYWNTFNVSMSLDNSSWTPVPFLDSTTDNRTQMADLGLIDLGNPQLTVYQEYYIPPQTVILPPNVTKQDALSALFNHLLIKMQATPADRTHWIEVFFGVFSLVFSIIGVILGFFYSGEASRSNTRNERKRGRKKSVPKAGNKGQKSLICTTTEDTLGILKWGKRRLLVEMLELFSLS